MPAFLRVNPHLRINLDLVTLIREADLNETYETNDTTRPGPAVRRRVPIPANSLVVEFSGKKKPVILTGTEAERLKNFVDGVGHALSGSGGDEKDTDTADLTAALRGERDFGALAGGT